MKRIILLSILVITFGCNTEELPVITPEIGPGYYRAINNDVDGKTSRSPIAFTGYETKNINARVMDDDPLGVLPYVLDEAVIDGCLTVKTWVCYSVPYLPIPSADAYGAKFGISFELSGDCSASPPTSLVIKDNALSSLRYPDPYTDTPYNLAGDKYWTVGTTIYLEEMNHVKDPSSGVCGLVIYMIPVNLITTGGLTLRYSMIREFQEEMYI